MQNTKIVFYPFPEGWPILSPAQVKPSEEPLKPTCLPDAIRRTITPDGQPFPLV